MAKLYYDLITNLVGNADDLATNELLNLLIFKKEGVGYFAVEVTGDSDWDVSTGINIDGEISNGTGLYGKWRGLGYRILNSDEDFKDIKDEQAFADLLENATLVGFYLDDDSCSELGCIPKEGVKVPSAEVTIDLSHAKQFSYEFKGKDLLTESEIYMLMAGETAEL